jgi:hypothetical protein
MPEQVELLHVPAAPRRTVPAVVQAIEQPYAQKVLQGWRQTGDPILPELTDWSAHHFWEQGRREDRRVATAHEAAGLIQLIHARPVRRRFVAQPRHWSSAGWYQGRRESPVTIDDPKNQPQLSAA